MRRIVERLTSRARATLSVTLSHEERQKRRGLLTLDDGSQAALMLERALPLVHGDLLLSDDQQVIEVRACAERVSVVRAPRPLDLARAAYHLGNRHVALAVAADRLTYLHDHVLDAMVAALGLSVSESLEPFEPEPGAYSHAHAEGEGAARHSHGEHGHGHDEHGHGHGEHEHGHGEHEHGHGEHEHGHGEHEHGHKHEHEHEHHDPGARARAAQVPVDHAPTLRSGVTRGGSK